MFPLQMSYPEQQRSPAGAYAPPPQGYQPPGSSYPPPQQAAYAPQQGYPPAPQQGYPPAPQQGYPPAPQQAYSQQLVGPPGYAAPQQGAVGYPPAPGGPAQQAPGYPPAPAGPGCPSGPAQQPVGYPPQPMQQQQAPQGQAHHKGVTCDGCSRAVVGVRFMCGNCLPSFDLCENCEGRFAHDPTHLFLKIYKPLPNNAYDRDASLLGYNLYTGEEDEY